MDWADDVAYSVHDVEDGIHGGYVRVRRLIDDADERAAVCQAVAETYSPEPADALAPVLDDLLADPALIAVADHDGSHRAQAALKGLTSVLTGRFVAAAVESTRAAHGTGPLRRYAADLVVPARIRAPVRVAQGHRAALRDAPAGRPATATSGSGPC